MSFLTKEEEETLKTLSTLTAWEDRGKLPFIPEELAKPLLKLGFVFQVNSMFTYSHEALDADIKTLVAVSLTKQGMAAVERLGV